MSFNVVSHRRSSLRDRVSVSEAVKVVVVVVVVETEVAPMSGNQNFTVVVHGCVAIRSSVRLKRKDIVPCYLKLFGVTGLFLTRRQQILQSALQNSIYP